MTGPPVTTIVEEGSFKGPPLATVPKRAQSYSNFVHSLEHHEELNAIPRKLSLGDSIHDDDSIAEVLAHGLLQYDLEDELLDASHEDYA